MAMFSAIIAAIGVAASIASVAVGMSSAKEAKKQGELSRQAEETRKTQMNLDSMRKRREMIRNAQVAAAQSQAVAGAQGASESSSAQGALAGISGQAGVNTLGVTQNQELGNRLFDINAQKATSMANQQSMQSISSGLGSLGGMMMKNSGTIAQVGSYLTGGAK